MKSFVFLIKMVCSTGAAEDGRAPTEELSCIQVRDFCSIRTAALD
jgi:hypothetical protein